MPEQLPGDNSNRSSLLDSLKSAGSAVGEVISDFSDRLREDRAERTAEKGQDSLSERLKQAAARARQELSDAQGGSDIRDASGRFAKEAEEIFKEMYGSVSRAADGTRDSEAYDKVRGQVSESVQSVRGSIDDAVAKARERTQKKDGAGAAGAGAGADDGADASSRLDDLLGRLRGDADKKQTDSPAEDTPDIIDGEVVSEDDQTNERK